MPPILAASGASQDAAADPAPLAVDTAAVCQICLEACAVETEQAQDADMKMVTQLCGRECRAEICVKCLREHLRVSIEAAFAGVLPRIRCPICLTRMNKAKWSAFATPELLAQYKQVCNNACSFQSPCCHNPDYTHLPVASGETPPSNHCRIIDPLMLVPSLKSKLPALRKLTRRYCFHRMTPKELLIHIEDAFGAHITSEMQLVLLEHLLPCIMDEERRAALLLCYHAKYKHVTTRCCGMALCFNCKRRWESDMDPLVCVEDDFDADCVVECRSCHVTIVKVEGCDYVKCLCGYEMDWSTELELHSLSNRKLVPVDLYDTKVCDAWWHWKHNMLHFLKYTALAFLHIKKTLPPFRKMLRRMVQRYIWKKRFQRALPQLQSQLRLRCLDYLVPKYPVLRDALQGYVRRHPFRRNFPKLKAELRLRCIDRTLPQHRAVLRPMLQRFVYRRRFQRDLPKLALELRHHRLDQLVRKFSPVLRPKAQQLVRHARWKRVCAGIRQCLEYRMFFGSYP